MENSNPITLARPEDAEPVMALYRSMFGQPGCTWNEHYPTPDLVERDIRDDNLFVMRSEAGDIVAAIAVDQDEEVDKLPCWHGAMGEYRELARLGVRRDCQNRGIARVMLRYGMDELKRRGCKGVHFLVSPNNPKALASYEKLHFDNLGTTELYGQSWYCYEKTFSTEGTEA